MDDYWKLIGLTVLALLLYFLAGGVVRLYYNSLSRFPGPKLAALTDWYCCYYEVFKDGGLIEHLETLHEQYGPVVRIGPTQLHFNDPRAYATIYASGSKFTKEPKTYAAFGEDEASFGYVDPHLAKARKDVLNPLFSRRAILRLESVIQEKIDILVSRVLSFQSPKKAVNMSRAFRSTTVDIITSYCFAESYDALSADDFRHPLLLVVEDSLNLLWTFKYFPSLRTLLLGAPDWLATFMNPNIQAFIGLNRKFNSQIDGILADPSSLDRADHEIIYHHLLNPHATKGRRDIPTKKSLFEEAVALLFAGSDTVGNICTIGTFYVLSNKTVLERLKQELCEAWPDQDVPLSYEALEKLPYLTAVIKESLRVGYGVVSHLPRIVGPTDTEIADYLVPAGTVVSIGQTFMPSNATIFPEPRKFDPERWLGPHANELETYLVPFSKGPRSCLGINLAWCELYLIFGNIFRKTDMDVYDTTVDDFKFRAYFLPSYQGHFHAHVREFVSI